MVRQTGNYSSYRKLDDNPAPSKTQPRRYTRLQKADKGSLCSRINGLEPKRQSSSQRYRCRPARQDASTRPYLLRPYPPFLPTNRKVAIHYNRGLMIQARKLRLLNWILLILTPGLLLAQAAPASPPAAPSGQTTGPKQANPEPSGGRVLGVVPEFNVTSYHDAKPLTPGGKWHLFVKQTFDPFQFVGVAFTSGISQAENQFPEYGQGAVGFGKRYGAGLADNVDGAFWGNFVLPVILKEDPRYFRLGEGSVMHRTGYAMAAAVVTRTDSGARRFNFSNVLGNLIAGGISNAYYPQSDRGVGLTFQRAGVVTGMGAIGGIAQEFLPDIDRKLFHRKKAPAASTNK